jgi:CheY-like chemotaxis protein
MVEAIMMIPEPLSRPRILLVDDEHQQLDLLAQVLRLSGLTILAAGGSMEALAFMEGTISQKIDLAILDYNMLVMNGCALADRLRSMRPELKIILYSGAVDIPPSQMSKVDVFVPKSDGIARLLAVIAGFVSGTRRPPNPAMERPPLMRSGLF